MTRQYTLSDEVAFDSFFLRFRFSRRCILRSGAELGGIQRASCVIFGVQRQALASCEVEDIPLYRVYQSVEFRIHQTRHYVSLIPSA